jgi:tetratricopeptide (TPR) repeat protein
MILSTSTSMSDLKITCLGEKKQSRADKAGRIKPLLDFNVRDECHTFANQAGTAPCLVWMAAFTVHVFAGEHAVAATAISRALTLNLNSAHAWMARGHVYCSSGQSDVAIQAFERAMRLSPLDGLAPGLHQRDSRCPSSRGPI